MARVVVNVPAEAKKGEVIEIRTLAGHAMETGFRRTQLGELIPRDIIRSLTCSARTSARVRAKRASPRARASPTPATSSRSRRCRMAPSGRRA